MNTGRTTITAAVLGLALLAAGPVRAQPTNPVLPVTATTAAATDLVARRLFLAGRKAFVRGAYEEAERLWERAFALSGRSGLLLNVAVARERQGRYAAAARALRDYLWLEPKDRHKSKIEGRIASLRRRVALRRGVDLHGWPLWTAAGGAVLLGVGAALLNVSAQRRYAQLAAGCGATRTGCSEDDVASVATTVHWSRSLLALSLASAGTAVVLWWLGRRDDPPPFSELEVSP